MGRIGQRIGSKPCPIQTSYALQCLPVREAAFKAQRELLNFLEVRIALNIIICIERSNLNCPNCPQNSEQIFRN